MTDKYSELNALAMAFPADLEFDSNETPFTLHPEYGVVGGDHAGTWTVYGPSFRLEGEDYDYDGPTYVEQCTREFAEFMVSARAAVLDLISEVKRGERMLVAACVSLGGVTEALGADMDSDADELIGMIGELKAENEELRKDADRREWEGFNNGLIRAGNMRPSINHGDDGARVLNDIRRQIDAAMSKEIKS